MKRAPVAPPRQAIALLSAAALAYEVLLIRLFSIVQWHHFAYMIISLALLGYGASGTFVALARNRLQRHFPLVYTACALLFAVTAMLCFLAAQQVAFNAEEVLWDPGQLLRLLLVYLLLTLPFFFVATTMALALDRFPARINQLYGLDLMGAGLGSLAIILALFVLLPVTALKTVAAVGLAAASLAWLEMRGRPRAWALLLALTVVLPFCLPDRWSTLIISPYKGLSQALRLGTTAVVAEYSSPLGLITVVDSPQVPWRHAPGLSLNAGSAPPPQVGVFIDGDNFTAITRFTGDLGPLGYLDQLPSALPYHLARPQRVLVLGAGAGSEVLQALYHRVGQITAVELNPQLVDLLRYQYRSFSGGIYTAPEVELQVGEARAFVAGNPARYDLIQVALLDSFAASAAGLYALHESYLYTLEAMQEYLAHLAPGGYLVISRWLTLPPRDALKLVATAVAAMERSQVVAPEKRLVLIRGLQTSTLLVKNGALGAEEIGRLHAFCASRAFDLGYYPGMREEEANRYNVLATPAFFAGATALLGQQRAAFMEHYKFNIAPASDDRPFFFQFMKWRSLAEIFALRAKGGMPLLEWGYLVLVATLVQAVVVSGALILLPLWWRRRSTAEAATPGRGRVFLYFFAVGFAFLFLEIALLQRFILFLQHPLYAAAVVLTGFLLFAGLGSACSKRLAADRGGRWLVWAGVGGITMLGLLYAAGLGPLFAALAWLPAGGRVVAALLLIAPLAFCMGIPFPTALGQLGADGGQLLPWAWGINGCASVISPVLATLLAIHCGFNAVIMTAILLYWLVALSFPVHSGRRSVLGG